MDQHFFNAFIQSIADAVAERLSQEGVLKPPVKAKPREAAEPPSDGAAMQELLTTREAAELLGVHYKSLERMRAHGTGPKFVKHGGSYRYRRCDLLGIK